MPAKPRFMAALVPTAGPDRFVSIRIEATNDRDVEFLGVTYRRTNRRTTGGWRIYREERP